jgi:CheY-like chemotaxis protein
MNPKKILLAEDDLDDQQIFYDFLNHRTDIDLMPMVGNGVELIDTLNMIDKKESLPNLIILDHNMPKRNGYQTLELLKSTARYEHIPVVVYSTYIDQRLTEACSDKGASAVMTKPITKKEYNKMIEAFLKVVQ